MKELIKQTIEGYKAKKLILQDTIKEYVQDKSLPLSDRWEIFCLAGQSNLFEPDYSVIQYESVDIDEYLSERNRYEIIYLDRVAKYFDEKEEFMEEILDYFAYSFKYDW